MCLGGIVCQVTLHRLRRCQWSDTGWRHSWSTTATKLFDFEWHFLFFYFNFPIPLPEQWSLQYFLTVQATLNMSVMTMMMIQLPFWYLVTGECGKSKELALCIKFWSRCSKWRGNSWRHRRVLGHCNIAMLHCGCRSVAAAEKLDSSAVGPVKGSIHSITASWVCSRLEKWWCSLLPIYFGKSCLSLFRAFRTNYTL